MREAVSCRNVVSHSTRIAIAIEVAVCALCRKARLAVVRETAVVIRQLVTTLAGLAPTVAELTLTAGGWNRQRAAKAATAVRRVAPVVRLARLSGRFQNGARGGVVIRRSAVRRPVKANFARRAIPVGVTRCTCRRDEGVASLRQTGTFGVVVSRGTLGARIGGRAIGWAGQARRRRAGKRARVWQAKVVAGEAIA